MAARNISKSTSPSSHEYLRDTLSFRYQECKSCRNRTELACIKCGFCYSCHWKREELEKKKFQFKPLITEVKYSYSPCTSSSTKTIMTTLSGESVLLQQKQQQTNISVGLLIYILFMVYSTMYAIIILLFKI
jgi:hypothetical protein